ncbi:MAG TPA: hypothetical protein PK719_08925 [Bacteroidales bacterium]|jgi:hypothetical protein|nr:hypothetical protein [Bacteroidales bacterium]OQB60329.1 MAG: hypothetical protein BWX96_02222 [Bacteroidetes bacterium ADurb.Bin145]HOU02806.1 hypothetical protein [Bacteroidales bacterium]HQG63769.1 hypothetical protein [Bacteroidales bacterium]HQK68790.1 hypothetical protein [Bacteroidales bacterium]
MKKLLIIVLPVWLITVSLYAQGEIDEQQKVFFRNERSLGILLNSDGFGLGYREGKRVDFLNKRFFEIDLGNLKHSKEYRYTYNNYGGGSGSFIFGKLNAVYFLRGGIGRQHEIFKKADLGGVAVRYFYSAGPVLALYKPIYYRVLYQISGSVYYFEIREEKFDVSIHDPTLIYSKASFFKGLDETKALPGLYAKAGFNFEYSRQDKIIHAIEMGAQVNAFPKEIPIMAAPHNKAIFFSLFLSYRLGVIVDPLHPEDMSIRNLFRRNRQ